MAAAAAACGQLGTATKSQTREQIRRNRENSNRRRAALLFLSNISLDGRPARSGSAERGGTRRRHDAVPEPSEPASATLAEPRSDDGTRSAACSSTSVSCGEVKKTTAATRRTGAGLLAVPPIVVLPSDAGRPELPLGRRRDSAPSAADGHLLSPSPSPSPSDGSLLPSPVAPRKSSTLLSVHSCNSLSSDLRQRTRNLSGGSPRPRHAKKIHFIKNMKQYDTRGSRIVLICAKRSLCAAFSVLPYGESFYLSEPTLSHPRRRHSSGNISTSLEMTALEGFHMETYNRSVSYARFLYPTDALVRRKPSSAADPTPRVPLWRSGRGAPAGGFPPSRLNGAVGLDLGPEDVSDYDPNVLSDPQWPCGKHKRVLIFASYMTTVIEYVKPSDLKKDMNETFKEKFPHIKLTLSKIRSLKREMRSVGEDCGLQPATIAMAFVYFEKLVLQGRLNKHNRKLVSAACILLAAKISSDLRKQEVIQLIDKLEERFRIGRRELISFEFTILVALEMALYLPESKVMPHYRRLVQQQL